MKNKIKFMFEGIFAMIAIYAVFGAAVMLLWNALMPQIFGLMPLNYLQAAGLLILIRVLFGGIGEGRPKYGRHRRVMEGGGLFHPGNKIREKWMNMSEDERKEFIEKEKDFFKYNRRFAHFRDFYDDVEGTGQNTETGTNKDK